MVVKTDCREAEVIMNHRNCNVAMSSTGNTKYKIW